MAEISVPRPIPALAPPAVTRRGIAARLPQGEDRRLLLWRVLWAPFWVGSDVPAPLLPARRPPRPANVGLAGDVVVAGLDQIARRLWLRHALHVVVRAAWLGLAIGCLWLLVEFRHGPAFDGDWLIRISAILVAVGIVFAAINRPTRRETAGMLDRTFGLHERLVTAVDHLGRGVPKQGERASVVYLQMADAANAVYELRRHRALGVRVPVRELVLAVFFGLLLAALYFLRGVGGDIPPLMAGAVPPFTPAVERTPEPDPTALAAQQAQQAPTVEQVLQRSERSNEAQRDLQALARALDDHAVTRPAAEAIGGGDYNQAADDLRNLAPNADQLSPTSREDLARDLDQAASEMSPGSSDLSNAAQQAAAGLRQGDQAAEQGMRGLGDAVEQTGGDVASQQELADQMRQAQEADAQGRASQSGNAGTSDAGQPGQPGQQAAAPPGEGNPSEGGAAEPGQPGASQSGSQQGQGQPGAGEAASQASDQPGQPGSGQAGEQQGAASQSGQGGDQSSADGAQSERGGGAGSGDSASDQSQGQAGAPQSGGEQGSQGAPAEQRVTDGSGAGADAGDPNAASETLTLPQAPSGQGVQTSDGGGSASRGSGAGASAGSGDAVQGEVGESGPDSNRVPPAYRPVVERYFGEQDGN